MKTFADVKRRLVVGATLVMERHDRSGLVGGANPLIGLPRKIAKVQTAAIQFEPHKSGAAGSWFPFPKASDVLVTGEDTFSVNLTPGDPSRVMAYRFIN